MTTPDAQISLVVTRLQKALTEPHPDACRLLHGRGRTFAGLEHLNADLYAPLLLLTLYEEPAPGWLDALVAAAQPLSCEAFGAIAVQRRFVRGAPLEVLWGELPEDAVAHEDGLRFALHLKAQNIGFFLDMKPGREWLRARAKHKSILNLFAYTCAFSIVATDAGADQVVNVDMHGPSLQLGRQNYLLNNLPLRDVHFFAHDVFRSWAKLRRFGPYDIIILDPPARQHKRFVTQKDYPRVVRRLPSLLQPGGEVLACLNDPYLESAFLRSLFDEADASWEIVERLPNHPAFPDAEPERALKLLHTRLLP